MFLGQNEPALISAPCWMDESGQKTFFHFPSVLYINTVIANHSHGSTYLVYPFNALPTYLQYIVTSLLFFLGEKSPKWLWHPHCKVRGLIYFSSPKPASTKWQHPSQNPKPSHCQVLKIIGQHLANKAYQKFVSTSMCIKDSICNNNVLQGAVLLVC